MVEHDSVVLQMPRWRTNDVNDGGALSIRSGNRIDSRELSDAGGCNKSSDTLDTGVPIGRVAGVQLVGVADPVESGRFDIVQQVEIEVAGDSVDRVYP
ncbi:hypothetical protein CGMCC3_g11241 [Colletotrichum fructicola]|nr:uncharacterized protein CGMCC3_g11241 [Colletotrichum fructicola]KAE9572767.1 hypothetical protein CGMCC3_g11241 [Colletotrichum fructicola]